MRVEQGHGLPIKQLQRAATTGLGRLVGDCSLGHRNPGLAQHHAGHRCSQTDRDHPLDEAPPRQSTGLHICNQLSKFRLFHRIGSSPVVNASFSSRRPHARGFGSWKSIRSGPPRESRIRANAKSPSVLPRDWLALPERCEPVSPVGPEEAIFD